ncbi:ABC transporter ATP-binding protein [Mesorhizobium sp. M0199]|uniref:ABC transporter ATP-binding protein n=1 Tax=Mesorhizobium sp. M0199 TaxID=2956911 RepID=UPI0033374C09
MRGVDLSVFEGEFLTLLGPSGSGKTTCLMMLAGFETPTGGEIFLKDRPISRLPPHRRNIGMVFQNYALFPHLSVGENLAFPLKIRKLPRAEIDERVKRALQMVRLDGVAQRNPSQLSGGQQQRVAVARALIFEPELILMDEPLGALDRTLREEMQFELKHLHERLGLSVVYVTHDQDEALTMSTRVAVLSQGKVQQIAPPRQIYEHPANRFVAGFVGANNLLAARVVSVDGDTCRVASCGQTLRARHYGHVGVGQDVQISIRPERIEVNGPSDAGNNNYIATVNEVVYLGDQLLLEASFGDVTLKLKVQNCASMGNLKKGKQARISWSAADCHALTD